MRNTRLSVIVKYAVFIIALYYCIMGLFGSQTSHISEPEGMKHLLCQIVLCNLVKTLTGLPKVSNVVLMVVDALRSDMISSQYFSPNWPHIHAIINEGLAICSTTTLTAPSVTSPRVKVFYHIYFKPTSLSGYCNRKCPGIHRRHLQPT